MTIGRRTPRRRAPALVAAVLLGLSACGPATTGATRVEVTEAGADPTLAPPAPTPISAAVPVATSAVSLAAQIGPRSSARRDPAHRSAATPGPTPVRLTIDSIGVRGAAVRPVGVEPGGAMQIPPAREVGWYRFGAAPGDPGSAVLAAHIAHNGRNGVFRRLVELHLGARVEIELSDGGRRVFTVTSLRQYRKAELPASTVFAREGAPRLVLITCGGEFLPSERSYQDNIVAFADPS